MVSECKPGDIVIHATKGEGIVTGTDGTYIFVDINGHGEIVKPEDLRLKTNDSA